MLAGRLEQAQPRVIAVEHDWLFAKKKLEEHDANIDMVEAIETIKNEDIALVYMAKIASD